MHCHIEKGNIVYLFLARQNLLRFHEKKFFFREIKNFVKYNVITSMDAKFPLRFHGRNENFVKLKWT